QMDAAKERLNHISVRGECRGVVVVANGNKKVTEVVIPEQLAKDGRTDEIGQLVMTATNSAIEKAEGVFESEMRTVAGGLMGGMGGLF
ncbi:MAG: YbaB/EbfC family nucleoid-associated protein, partial [Flavobacteriales bacterium]|nr:YbaB/EbfC family nucleoid-associated protein [Flavobacteriales bacterium]